MHHASAPFIPPFALDPTGDRPRYQQIAAWFQHAIRTGALRPGQRVPSTRDLAKALHVSRIPVLSAYEQLIAEGYFKPWVGVGTCVATTIPVGGVQAGRGNDRLTGGGSANGSRRTSSRRAALLREPAQQWLDETTGCHADIPGAEEFPAGIWSRLVIRHAHGTSAERTIDGHSTGIGPFRSALTRYLGALRNIRCDESQILVTTGAQQALQICALAILDPGDRVWMEEPGYPGAQQAFRAAGGQLVPVPVDSQGMDVSWGLRADSGVRAAYVTPAAQFPLGATLSRDRRRAMLEWAERGGAWIIEDDYGAELRLGHSGPPLKAEDNAQRVIYIGTLSAVMFPALRLGYMVVPEDLVEDFTAVCIANGIFPSPLYQSAMTDFIEEGHLSRRIKRLSAAYSKRRNGLLDALPAELPQTLQVLEGDAATHLLILFPPGVPDTEVAQRVKVRGLKIRPLSQCYLHPPERGGLVLDYTNLHPDAALEAALAIASALR